MATAEDDEPRISPHLDAPGGDVVSPWHVSPREGAARAPALAGADD